MGINSNGTNNLRNLRKMNNYTQENVADHLHLSRSAYCQYELGKRRPDLSTIMELSKFYSVPMETLVYDEAPAPSEGFSQLSTMYLSLSKAGQKQVEDLIHSLYIRESMLFDS